MSPTTRTIVDGVTDAQVELDALAEQKEVKKLLTVETTASRIELNGNGRHRPKAAAR